MKQINYKKLILPNIPYVFFVYLFDKVGQAVRLAPGADISAKILNITKGFSAAFENALPSIYPLDLLVGIVGAVVIRLIVYVKGKNAKKYRQGEEYGSARWGNQKDIETYIEPVRTLNAQPRIEGKSTGRIVYAFPKIVIPDDKLLEVEIYEKGGGRHQRFYIENSALVDARIVNELIGE